MPFNMCHLLLKMATYETLLSWLQLYTGSHFAGIIVLLPVGRRWALGVIFFFVSLASSLALGGL